ncbi:hypothetical protein [Granulicella sibirica]|nr:hypothetical protein [Granulicella sibirica]
MVCPTCGASFDGVGNFCPHCGSRVTQQAGPASPPPPYPGYGYGVPVQGYPPPAYAIPQTMRVQRNLQLLAILWGCFAVYRLVTGIVSIFFLHMFTHRGMFGHHFPFGSDGAPWVAAMMPFNIVTTLGFVGLAVLVGYGLFERRPWGRTTAIVMSILSMIHFPIGTALGIFTLWVLAPASSALEYESIADRSRPGF